MDNYKEESKIQKIIRMLEKAIEDGKIDDIIVQQSNGGINYGIMEKKVILRVENLTEEEEKKIQELATKAKIGAHVREKMVINANDKYNDLLEPFTYPDEFPNKEGVRYTPEDLEKFAEVSERRNIKQSPKKTTKKRYKSNKIKVAIKDILDKMENLSISEKQKAKIKKIIKNALEKGKKYIAVGIATLIAFFGSIYIAKQITGDQSKVREEITTVENGMEEDTTVKTIKEENEIDTVKEVKEDFVKKYLEAYNETYGTEYTQADLLTSFMNGIEIFELEDGRKVTKGNYPYETKNKLGQIGEYKAAHMTGNLIQIVLSNGAILGSYDIITGEFIYSGNQLRDLTNENFDEPTLEKLGINLEKLAAAAKVNEAKHGEDKKSIAERIEHYKNTDTELGKQ